MAQGLAKLSKTKKSGGSQKRKVLKKKTLSKGRKEYRARKTRSAASYRDEKETTKAINKKNEAIVAAKAVSVGTQFFLSDVAEKGKKEMKKQIKERNKKQGKATEMSDRLKDQLKRLGRDA